MNLNWKSLLVVATLSLGAGLGACESAPPATNAPGTETKPAEGVAPAPAVKEGEKPAEAMKKDEKSGDAMKKSGDAMKKDEKSGDAMKKDEKSGDAMKKDDKKPADAPKTEAK